LSYTPARKGTLLFPSGPSDHLHVIVTNSCENKQHLLLSVTSIKTDMHYDPTCVLAPGDHPFIKHPSFVFYSKADQKASAHITRMVELCYFVPKDDVSEELINKIRDGIQVSEFSPPWAISYYLRNKDR